MTRIAEDIVAEHGRIAEVFDQVGPDAPAGVDDWSAADLAAHLLSQVAVGGFVVFAGRSLVARGVRLNDFAGSTTNHVVAVFRRKGFEHAVESLRAGPPRLLLRDRVAPVSLFEVWVHHDDLRRANDLDPPDEPETLDRAVDFALRYQRNALKSIHVEHEASHGDLLRWLAGRPSSIPATSPPLRF